MAEPDRPIFLVRESYRRRRLGDAARLTPVFGLALLLLPAIWASDNRTADVIIFIFLVWALLIAVMALLSRHLSGEMGGEAPQDRPPEI